MPPNRRAAADLLQDRFAGRHVKSLLGHYEKAVEYSQRSDWESAIAKTGKLVEAVLKALWVASGETVPSGKEFKAGKIIDNLAQKTGMEESIRLTIPRACRIVYEIASNRGARHDADEIDPNEMDATVAVSVCSWIVAEMLRVAQKGSLDPAGVQEIVAGLIQKRYPHIEEVQGRIYVSIKGLSAREIAIAALFKRYPGRLSREELFETLKRHQVKDANAKMAVSRLTGVVDVDQKGCYRLLSSGVQEAEAITR